MLFSIFSVFKLWKDKKFEVVLTIAQVEVELELHFSSYSSTMWRISYEWEPITWGLTSFSGYFIPSVYLTL